MRKLLLLLVFPFVIHAAGPLTHLVLGEEFFKCTTSLQPEDRDAFLIGNVFPDIRYLGEISRSETHEVGVQLDDIYGAPTPFIAGMRLHAYVDEVREEFALQMNIYDLLEGQILQAHFLKLIEEEILYNEMEAQGFISVFDTVIDDELAWKVSHQRWHRYMRDYLSKRPSVLLRELAEKNIPYFNISPETILLWSELLPMMAEKQEFRDYVQAMMEMFSLKFRHE